MLQKEVIAMTNMRNLAGLKLMLGQMEVIPNRPDLNFAKIEELVEKATSEDVDILVLPEMCIPGYLIGDMWEDDCFVRDMEYWNNKVVRLSADELVIVFGSLLFDERKKGEDGRIRKYNAGIIAQNGNYLSPSVKSLQPNYRFFDDTRHFYSTRKILLEDNAASEGTDGNLGLYDYLNPVAIATRIGQINLGVILCEDAWHQDYPENPAKILADKGADLLLDLSSSPWGWQKNRKRHQVMKDTLADCQIPLVYVNIVGAQNNGKNLIQFDGVSTIYDRDGRIVHESGSRIEATDVFTFSKEMPEVEIETKGDTVELYEALLYAHEKMREMLPPGMRRVMIGLSGGIDSAVELALHAIVFGPENVYAFNMPSQVVDEKTEGLKDTAAIMAKNFGVNYEVVPINSIVNAIVKTTGVTVGSLAYENVQARSRMEVLAAKAQELGGVFSSNGNKVELAFGYCTIAGDLEGYFSGLMDLLKREVRQIANHINEVVYQKEMIPRVCIEQRPTAGLAKDQEDPFDYGTLERRGYHDELVRAFVEFNKNPEWVLAMFLQDNLEKEIKLPKGLIWQLFPSAVDFVEDLEYCWRLLHRGVIKRIRSVTGPIFSRRAFGYDRREALLSPYFTQKYKSLKMQALNKRMQIGILGGSFDPPGKHHAQILRKCTEIFDKVIVVPCGLRPDKGNVKEVQHRTRLTELEFLDFVPNVELDLFDLAGGTFTRTWKLDEIYNKKYPRADVWHIVGPDIIVGGGKQKSEIHRTWDHAEHIWQNLKFAIIQTDDSECSPTDYPHIYKVIDMGEIKGRSTQIRNRVASGESISGLVSKEIAKYIRDHGLYSD